MPTLQQVMQFFETMEKTPTIILIVGAFTIMSLTVLVSRIEFAGIRMVFLTILTTGIFYAAWSMQDINGAFFLNLSTEFVGALVVVILLNEWIANQRWLFPVVFVLVALSTFLIGIPEPKLQQAFINLSAELVGAFIIYISLHKPDWIWGDRRPLHERQMQRLAEEMEIEKEVAIKLAIEEERERIKQEILHEMDEWRMNATNWNVAIKIAGADRKELKEKVGQLRGVLSDMKILRIEDDDTHAHCYVIGSIKR